MHIMSARNRSEFLSIPQLVRFTVAEGSGGSEVTLLFKSTSLILKYIVRMTKLRLLLLRVGQEWLAYGVEVADDQEHPAFIWSILEHEDELNALKIFLEDSNCYIFLFNELAVNVDWAKIPIDLSLDTARHLIEKSVLAVHGDTRAEIALKELFQAMGVNRESADGRVALELPQTSEWHPIHSTYITNRANRSDLLIFDEDEGGQQEEVALWLIDSLHPKGAVKNPQIHDVGGACELTDLLLCYEFGVFLLESKTLGILARGALPDRTKLTRDLAKRVKKRRAS